MEALILAAGKGTRAHPLTQNTPKPMLPIFDRPLMSHLIQQLSSQGIDDLIINTSYLPETIENYFGNGWHHGVNITYAREGFLLDGRFVGRALGSAGAMKNARSKFATFQNTFTVLCGDAFIDLDLNAMLETHRASGAIATVAAKKVAIEQVHKYGIIVEGDDNLVLSFQEKPQQSEAKSRVANIGVYIFEPDIIDFIPEDTETDIALDLFPAVLDAGGKIACFKSDSTWLDIGNIQDYCNTLFDLLGGSLGAFSVPGQEIHPHIYAGTNVRISKEADISGPVFLGTGVNIERGTKIVGPAIIGEYCEVKPQALIKNSILYPYTRVNPSTALIRQLASPNWSITIPFSDNPASIAEPLEGVGSVFKDMTYKPAHEWAELNAIPPQFEFPRKTG